MLGPRLGLGDFVPLMDYGAKKEVERRCSVQNPGELRWQGWLAGKQTWVDREAGNVTANDGGMREVEQRVWWQ